MSTFKDITGQRFGRWVVVSVNRRSSPSKRYWLCVCDCGTRRDLQASSLKRGTSRSCGCLSGEVTAERQRKKFTTHGKSRTPEYLTWKNMRQRCRNPNRPDFKNYGGRGIEDRYPGFEAFATDLGKKPPGTTLDRKDNDGHYEKGNCRWATRSQQNRNRRPFKHKSTAISADRPFT
jgi:hypothetical protein